MRATDKDVEHIRSLYEGRQVFQGDLHNHAATGGTSDGGRTLEHWKGALEALGMDFAAILDHRQVRHMYLPEWEDGLFVSGTEPGTQIVDSNATAKEMHYNMIFPSPKPLEELLAEFTEYEFTGGSEGHFKYPRFTRERFGELIDAVKAKGGFFVHPHPKQCMQSDDPMDYWYRDETGIEVFYYDMRNEWTAANYELWTTLLAMGKRLWVCAGQDNHRCAADTALTTIYAEEKSTASYLDHLRVGDFVCGSVGIKMCVDNVLMGGRAKLEGGRLVVAVDNFHKSIRNTEHSFRINILDNDGVVLSEKISCEEASYFAIDTKDKAFYRVEIFDDTLGLRIAIGNPIWNL